MTTVWIHSGTNAVEIRTSDETVDNAHVVCTVYAVAYTNVKASDPAKCAAKVPGATWDGGKAGARRWAFEELAKR